MFLTPDERFTFISSSLVRQIAARVGRALERMGLLQRDAESAWLELPPVEDVDAMRQIIGSAVCGKI